jgi:hypothetical protein
MHWALCVCVCVCAIALKIRGTTCRCVRADTYTLLTNQSGSCIVMRTQLPVSVNGYNSKQAIDVKIAMSKAETEETQ